MFKYEKNIECHFNALSRLRTLVKEQYVKSYGERMGVALSLATSLLYKRPNNSEFSNNM